MDFREFRSQVVRVPFTYDGEEFWVGYRPRAILEEDIEMMAWLSLARLDVDLSPVNEAVAAQQAQPNRAQRRAAEKAARVARATPRAKAHDQQSKVPTLIDHMKRLIADWSLTWDDEPWPVCEENFRQVDPLMRTVMVSSIVEDYMDRPNQMSSSSRSSEETTASGLTGPASASEPSSGATTEPGRAAGSSHGTS